MRGGNLEFTRYPRQGQEDQEAVKERGPRRVKGAVAYEGWRGLWIYKLTFEH